MHSSTSTATTITKRVDTHEYKPCTPFLHGVHRSPLTLSQTCLDQVIDTGNDDAKLQWKVIDADKAQRMAEAVDKTLSNDAFKTIGVSVQVSEIVSQLHRA
jgi:hypothetical protein